jgi:hypothetical protein
MPTDFVVIVKASTPRISRMIEGMAPPRAADQNVRDGAVSRGR